MLDSKQQEMASCIDELTKKHKAAWLGKHFNMMYVKLLPPPPYLPFEKLIKKTQKFQPSY